MSRSVEQWQGKTDDSAIPPRVKMRVEKRGGSVCQECGRPFSERNEPEFDHIKALTNGGSHAEDNLQALCKPCHGMKTKTDVAEKKVVNRKRGKSMGYLAPKHKWQSGGFRTRPPQNSTRAPNKFCAWRGYARSDA